MAWSLLTVSLCTAGVEVSGRFELVLVERIHTTGGAYDAKKHSTVRPDYSREEHSIKAAACTSLKRSWSIWYGLHIFCSEFYASLIFNDMASFSVVCAFTKLLQYILLLLLWPLHLQEERNKHLDVEMDWLYTDIWTITGFVRLLNI